ncbi:HsdM family class I SAM-dependent methyltransferase [Pseudonocardia sichuanensis]
MAGDTTVSTGDIARLGRVGRAAVSNWRRRYDDFPAPVSGTSSNPRFALADVEAWLRRNGKRYRLSPADRAWQHLLSDGPELLLPHRLAAAGAHLLARHAPDLLPLLPEDAPAVDDPELAALLDEVAATAGPAAAFEDLCGRHQRGAGRPSDALATAMTRIALPDGGGRVVDPACGTGGLLLVAGAGGARGQEADPAAACIAASRLLLAGARSAPVALGDALRRDAFAGAEFDAVVSAPPVTERGWPHDALVGDARFAHGLPPRTEPELAWVQHGLARVRPGGRVVLRLPAAVTSRRPGRRIRANLLRAGALRAVLTIEDEARAADVWVLRRPLPGEPVPSELLLARTAPDAAAELWERFASGRPTGTGARVVGVVELLDDEVDLSPERHLHRRAPADAGPRVAELLADAPAGTPDLRVSNGAHEGTAAVTVGELARRGMLTVRHAARDADAADEGSVPVLTVSDLATGTVATGRTSTAAGRVRVRPGDVVGAPMGRARVADRAAVLGPGLTAYRLDPEQLDPEYLAGTLRAAPAPTGASSRHGQRVRVRLLPIAEQRALGAAFRGLLDAADTARAAAERAETLLRLGGEGLVEGWLRPG